MRECEEGQKRGWSMIPSQPSVFLPLPVQCHGGGTQKADKQTVNEKVSGRFVAKGTRPF